MEQYDTTQEEIPEGIINAPEKSPESSKGIKIIKPILLGWIAGIILIFNVTSPFVFVFLLAGGIIPLIPIIAFHSIIVHQVLSRSKETITYSILACCGGASLGVRFIVIPYELLFDGFFNKCDLPFIVNIQFLNQHHVAYIFFVAGSLLGYLIIYLSFVLLKEKLSLLISGILLCVTALVALFSLIPYASHGSFSIGVVGYLPFFYILVAFGLGNIMVSLKPDYVACDSPKENDNSEE